MLLFRAKIALKFLYLTIQKIQDPQGLRMSTSQDWQHKILHFIHLQPPQLRWKWKKYQFFTLFSPPKTYTKTTKYSALKVKLWKTKFFKALVKFQSFSNKKIPPGDPTPMHDIFPHVSVNRAPIAICKDYLCLPTL